jgi:hypothetical protein
MHASLLKIWRYDSVKACECLDIVYCNKLHKTRVRALSWITAKRNSIVDCKGKSKKVEVVPEAPDHEGMREWRYTSTTLDLSTRLRCVVSFTPMPLYPLALRKGSLVPIGLNAWWASELVWTLCRRERSLVPVKNRTQVVLPVACIFTPREREPPVPIVR